MAKIWRMLLGLVALGLLVVAGLYFGRNPENKDLDQAARTGVPGQFVQLTDGVTHYDLAGPDSGRRVVLVHGFSTPYYIWDSTAVALTAAGFRVARYDYFGRGYSDRPDVPYSLDLFDRQLSELLDSLGWKEPVDLMGLSFGGPVTATFTGRHPERVRTLTLVDPAAGPRERPSLMFRIPVLGRALWQGMAVPGMAGNQLTDFVEPARWPDWPERYRVQMQYRGFGRALLSTSIEFGSVTPDSLYAAVGRTRVPVLIIWGAEDKTVPIEHAKGVRQAIPQARFDSIPKAGHLPHMERTDLVNPLLLEFLRATPDPR
jgi:pimeloyl-ACP methyl ester carboxylesterase